MAGIKNEYSKQHYHTIAAKIGETSDYVWPVEHMLTLLFSEGPQIGQKALKGSIMPKEAYDRWIGNAKSELNG